MSEQLDFLWRQLPNLLWGFPNHRPGGLLLSILLSAGAIAVGLCLAVGLGFGLHSRFGAIRILSGRVIWVIRGIPLIVLLVLLFQFLGTGSLFGVNFSAFWSAAVTLTLYSAAYQADIVGAGIAAVPQQLCDDARLLGATRVTVARTVTLPYCLRAMRPALTTQAITIFKDSSVVVVLGVADLTTNARIALGGDVSMRPTGLRPTCWLASCIGVLRSASHGRYTNTVVQLRSCCAALMGRRLPVPVSLGLGLLVLGFVGVAWTDLANDTLRAEVVTNTIAWLLVACAGYVLLLRLQVTGSSTTGLKWFLLLGLGLRLLLLISEPTLSDDVYRYLWEGHLVSEGVSPYSFAIDSPLGDAYDIPARGLANNTSLASPYLPVAHGVFGAAAVVLPSEPWSMQLIMIGFDVLAATMIVKLLRTARLPERRVLLYWLNPLVIIEVAHGAHIDAMILGFATLGLWLSLEKARTSTIAVYGGPAFIAAATLTRPLAALFIPVLFWVWTWRQRITWAVVMAVPVGLAGVAAGFGFNEEMTGSGVFGSARAYTETFRFNSGIYHWFEQWVGSQGLDDQGWNEPVALTRLLVALVVGALLLAVFIVARTKREPRAILRMLAVPLMIYVVLTPVLHPWYTLSLLGFLPFLAPGDDERSARWVTVAPWIGLSTLALLSYLTYEDPQAFAEREWVRRIEWYPTLALVLMSLLWAVREFGLAGKHSSGSSLAE